MSLEKRRKKKDEFIYGVLTTTNNLLKMCIYIVWHSHAQNSVRWTTVVCLWPRFPPNIGTWKCKCKCGTNLLSQPNNSFPVCVLRILTAGENTFNSNDNSFVVGKDQRNGIAASVTWAKKCVGYFSKCGEEASITTGSPDNGSVFTAVVHAATSVPRAKE